MPYVYQKFPLSLYLRGDASSDHVIVTSEDEEAAKRAEGFRGAWEPQEKAEPISPAAVIEASSLASAHEVAAQAVEQIKRRRGRPRKVTE